MEQIIFDEKAISALKHNISHLQDCLRYIPTPIKTMKWDCNIFKKEVCLDDTVRYISDKLERITKIIELAQECKN